jgi:hypothetical protein
MTHNTHLVAALAWALDNMPNDPPAAWPGGWSPAQDAMWRSNLAAARRVLDAARRGRSLPLPKDLPRRPR